MKINQTEIFIFIESEIINFMYLLRSSGFNLVSKCSRVSFSARELHLWIK